MKVKLPERELTRIVRRVTTLVDTEWRYCCGLVIRRDKKSFVLTCAHVLFLLDGKTLSTRPTNIKKILPIGEDSAHCAQTSTAEIVVMSRKLDFAILKLNDDIFQESTSMKSCHLHEGANVFCCDDKVLTHRLPKVSAGKIKPVNKRYPKHIHTDHHLAWGCCGSGLFSPNGTCIGMAQMGYCKENPDEENDSYFMSLNPIMEYSSKNGFDFP